jgi:hypothetical protein
MDRAPLVNLPTAHRLDMWMSGGKEFWAYPARGPMSAICARPPVMIMTQASAAAGRAFGQAAAEESTLHSITGPDLAVEAAWEVLRGKFGPAFWRRDEFTMATSTPAHPSIPRLASLRRSRVEEVPLLMPAAEEVFEESNGMTPERCGVKESFTRSMMHLARIHRSFVAFDSDGVLFKAEVNIIRANKCQIKGVWVRADRRGEGFGVSGMATVLDTVLDSFASTATLRVDGKNFRARSVYSRVGFSDVGHTRSVLLPPPAD